MAEVVEITEQDRIDAENILEQYLIDAVPDADFSKGSALRDLCIVALAYVHAFWTKERDYMKARQSLLLLGALTGADVDAAVDEILSNWFVTRKTGRKSTGTVTVYLSTNDPVSIASTANFYKTATLLFNPNSITALTYGPEDMQPVTNSTGEIVAYTIRVPLISYGTGVNYDVTPGAFVDFTRFSVNILRVESTEIFTGGASDETTEEMLARSETAITVRDLNSARSIDAVLKEEFTQVDDVTVIGYGNPEMIRDLVVELATNTRIHAGGHVDAYLRSPITYAKTFTGEIGATFADPRDGYYILRDNTIVDDTYNFLDLPPPAAAGDAVAVGDVIEVYNADVTAEANRYIVKEATRYGVFVDRRSSFPSALPEVDSTYDDGKVGAGETGQVYLLHSDSYTFDSALVEDGGDVGNYIQITESAGGVNNGLWKIENVVGGDAKLITALGPFANFTDETGLDWNIVTRVVEYSVGDNPPSYNNKIARRYSGEFTKTIQDDGKIVLPAEPVYRITDVSFADATSPYAPFDRVLFPIRSNQEPAYKTTGQLEEMEYEVRCHNPPEAFSGWQVMELDVGWPDGVGVHESKDYFNGQSLRVTYDALTGYDSVWAYMISGDQRILCGSVIPKGMHPTYLHMNIRYSTSKTATEGLDTAEAAESLAAFINEFDTREDMDTSDIVSHLRENFQVVGYVEPLTVYYDLLAPDGRVIYYMTTDQITVDSGKVIDPTTDEPPISTQTWLLFDSPISLGVSDNTLRYLTVETLVTFEEI
jgi:hypothetical protein